MTQKDKTDHRDGQRMGGSRGLNLNEGQNSGDWGTGEEGKVPCGAGGHPPCSHPP